jgi:hypothetical protein
MVETNEFTVVSVFGRGNWIARELNLLGVRVTIIDLTHRMGLWPVEDSEGPFGFFKSEKTSQAQLESLMVEDPFVESSHGFTVWLKSGPIEFKSPQFTHRTKAIGVHQDQSDASLTGQIQKINVMDFKGSWVLGLAEYLGRTQYRESSDLQSCSPHAHPLGAHFSFRRSSRLGHDRGNKWLHESGVQVVQNTELLDLALDDGKKLSALELKGEIQGLLRSHQLVWCLTSEETHHISETIHNKLFLSKAESEWCWVRYRWSVDLSPEIEVLPEYLLVISEVEAPWTHANFQIVVRTALKDQFDSWIFIPSVQRFNKDYLAQWGDRLLRELAARLPAAHPQILSFPQEYYYTFSDLGPSRFPVWSATTKAKRVQAKNIHFASPEVWSHHTPSIYSVFIKDFIGQMKIWWDKERARRLKAEERKAAT